METRHMEVRNMEILLVILALAFAATADASDTKGGVNHVRGESGAYIFSFGANEEK